MPTTPHIIGLSVPVAINATGERKVPSFEATIYTGGELEIAGYDSPVVLDLAGLTTGNVLVANLDHDSTKRVGNFTVQNDGNKLVARGTASAATPWRDEVVNSARDGYQWQASVEVVPQSLQNLNRGETTKVNGRDFTGPKYITRRGILKAFAFVTHGADDATSVAIAAQKRGNRMQNYSDFQSWMAGVFPNVDTSLMTPTELAGWHANFHGRDVPIAADFAGTAPMVYATADPVESEKHRLRQIDAACDGTWGEHTERVEQLKAQAVGGEYSVDELLKHLREIRREKLEASVPMAHSVQAGRRENPGQVIEAAFCLAGGLNKPERYFPEQLLDQAARIQRDCGLQSLIMQAACGNGYQAHPAEGITQGNIRRVLEAAFAPQHAAGFSTLSLAGILSNVSNKYLLDGWTETSGDEWQKISDVKPVKNFKTNTFYRLLESAEYEEIGPAGEIKHGTVGEDSMTVKAATYGKMYAITRTDIINDDLGALTDMPRRIGRGAGMKFRRIYWAAFLADDSFFHSDNNNVVTGAGTALTTDGTALQTALTSFRGMRTSAADGRKLIGGKPAVIMVPPELEIVARSLLTSTGIVATGATDTTMPSGNPYAGLAELVVVDWLSDSDLTGYSAAEWYLFRSPSIAPAMIVAFLNGQQSPTVETADADFNTLGIQMRGYHDFGVGRGEPLCGVQVAGTPAGE